MKFKKGDKVVMVTENTYYGGTKKTFFFYNPRGYAVFSGGDSSELVRVDHENGMTWNMKESELDFYKPAPVPHYVVGKWYDVYGKSLPLTAILPCNGWSNAFRCVQKQLEFGEGKEKVFGKCSHRPGNCNNSNDILDPRYPLSAVQPEEVKKEEKIEAGDIVERITMGYGNIRQGGRYVVKRINSVGSMTLEEDSECTYTDNNFKLISKAKKQEAPSVVADEACPKDTAYVFSSTFSTSPIWEFPSTFKGRHYDRVVIEDLYSSHLEHLELARKRGWLSYTPKKEKNIGGKIMSLFKKLLNPKQARQDKYGVYTTAGDLNFSQPEVQESILEVIQEKLDQKLEAREKAEEKK